MFAASTKAVENSRPSPSSRSALVRWLRAWQQVVIAELLLLLEFRRLV